MGLAAWHNLLVEVNLQPLHDCRCSLLLSGPDPAVPRTRLADSCDRKTVEDWVGKAERRKVIDGAP